MRLKRKVKIAKQKSQRYKLMRLLTEDMSTVIEKSDVITSPELEIILNKVHEKWKFELHKWDN